MSRQLASLLVDMKVNSAELRSELQKANGYLKGFGDQVNKVGGLIAASLSAAAIVSFGKSCATAFMHTEQAGKKLEAQLRLLGYQSKELAGELKAQAGAFQENLGVSDDMVTQMQTILVSFGVAPKEIGKTVQALLDYSTIMGEDAVGATKQLIESIESGKLRGLKSFGISIADAGDKAKNLAAAVDAIGGKFGGAAAANADTLAGKVTNLGNQWEDMQKGFGQFFAVIESKVHVLELLAKGISGVTRALSGEGAADANTVGRHLMLQEAQKRQRDAIAKVNQVSRKDSYGNNLYGPVDKAKADADLKLANQALQAAARSFSASVGSQSGSLSSTGQSAAAKKQFGLSPEALASMTEQQIADYTERQKSAKEAAKQKAAADKKFRGEEREAEAYVSDIDAQIRKSAEATKEAEEAWTQSFVDAQKEAAAKVSQALKDAAAATAATFEAVKSSAVNYALSTVGGKMGRAGGLLGAGMAGMGQGASLGGLAGPKGAALGAAAGFAGGAMFELITSSDGFRRTVEMVDDIIKEVAEVYGENIAAFQPLIAITAKLTSAALEPFKGAVESVARIVERLVPTLLPFAEVFARLAGYATDILFSTEMLAASMKVSEAMGKGLFESVKFAGKSMLGIAAGIVSFWNQLLGTFADNLRQVADFDVAGARPFALLDEVAKTVGGLALPTLAAGLESAAGVLAAMTYPEFTAAVEDATKATDKQTEAINKSLGAWLNVPEGYRVALARFDSMTAEGGALQSVTGKPSAAGIIMNIEVKTDDPRVLMSKLKQLAERENVLMFGTEEAT